MIPLALAAQVDQAEASLRELLGDYEIWRTDPTSMNACGLVAVDVLAVLSEAWEKPVQVRLDLITAQLLAWKRLAGA